MPIHKTDIFPPFSVSTFFNEKPLIVGFALGLPVQPGLRACLNFTFLKTNTLGADCGFNQLFIPIIAFLNPMSSH